jgi:hypothetical protein
VAVEYVVYDQRELSEAPTIATLRADSSVRRRSSDTGRAASPGDSVASGTLIGRRY